MLLWIWCQIQAFRRLKGDKLHGQAVWPCVLMFVSNLTHLPSVTWCRLTADQTEFQLHLKSDFKSFQELHRFIVPVHPPARLINSIKGSYDEAPTDCNGRVMFNYLHNITKKFSSLKESLVVKQSQTHTHMKETPEFTTRRTFFVYEIKSSDSETRKH